MFSIIIPVWNQEEMTRECIDSVKENSFGDYEIILVDNGSEKSFDDLRHEYNISIIRNEKNLGFPVAVNQGIKKATGDIIVLLNNDTIVTPGWLEGIFIGLGKYAIVGPMTNYCAGFQQIVLPSYDGLEDLYEQAKIFKKKNEGKVYEVNWVIGFCMAFKKSLYDELGDFDESFWPCSGEEIDFCMRAKSKGYKIGVLNDVFIHHHGSITFKDMDIDYNAIVERNENHLDKRWGINVFGSQKCLGIVFDEEEKIRLNLGSGPFPLPGFINIDNNKDKQPDVVADVTDLPYGNESVDEINAGHLLEHLTYEEGRKALIHWYGVLKEGGRISITVPNFDFLVKKYIDNPTAEGLKELNDRIIYAREFNNHSAHKYCYGENLLKEIIASAGFKDLEKMPMNHQYYPHDNVDWQIGITAIKGEGRDANI